MFSYIFMKILESRPSRYDKGINILTGGHAKRIKRKIVDRWIRPGLEILDIGCGTGELLELAARAGARVSGIDISEGMLSIAQNRIKKIEALGKNKLYHAGVIELDRLFDDKSFDVVTSTLVFSELYTAERQWAYTEIRRILRDSGLFILAGEVRPNSIVKRFLHFLVRLPLAIVTYLIAQTGTRAVPDMAGELNRAGFEVLGEQRSLLESFSVVWARKKLVTPVEKPAETLITGSDQDISFIRTVWDYTGRWFPCPVEPGLRKIGMPGKDAPVFVTCNFHLTVRRVEKALSAMNAWLLVAPTSGINVWCASCGGVLTAHSVASVLKTSGISKKILHRHIVLPQLSASGIDIQKLKKVTGFNAVFGPAYARDIPEYMEKKERKSWNMCLADFSLRFRLEMLLSMNAVIWFTIAAIILAVRPALLWKFSLLFWGAGAVLYTGYPWLPGDSGWLKGFGLGILIIIGISFEITPSSIKIGFDHWGWMISVLIVCFWLGFDLRGIVEGSRSEAEKFIEKLGLHSFGKLYSSNSKSTGVLHYDTALCSQCHTCINVCPKGVFGFTDGEKGLKPVHPEACFTCGACVCQCPEGALKIS